MASACMPQTTLEYDRSPKPTPLWPSWFVVGSLSRNAANFKSAISASFEIDSAFKIHHNLCRFLRAGAENATNGVPAHKLWVKTPLVANRVAVAKIDTSCGGFRGRHLAILGAFTDRVRWWPPEGPEWANLSRHRSPISGARFPELLEVISNKYSERIK